MAEDDEAESFTGNEAVLIYSTEAGRMSLHGYNPRIPLGAAQYQISQENDGWRIEEGKNLKRPVDIKALAEIAERIAPWVKAVYAIPRLFYKDIEWGGVYCPKGSVIFITYNNADQRSLSSTLYHELFHAVQEKMSDHYSDDYDSLMSRVNSLAVKYDDPEYLDTEIEQSARAFQYFSMMMDSGVTFYFQKKTDDPTLNFFLSVYQGDFAQQLQEGKASLDVPQKAQKLRSLLPW